MFILYMYNENIENKKKSSSRSYIFHCSEEWKYIEDIYSFAVNTINIVIEWNENISIFTSAKHK